MTHQWKNRDRVPAEIWEPIVDRLSDVLSDALMRVPDAARQDMVDWFEAAQAKVDPYGESWVTLVFLEVLDEVRADA